MGTNRKQPFGYKMEMGHIVFHLIEYREVQCIFTEYQKGKSFKELAEAMAQKGIPYDGDKPWNKNMIARILADARYTGADGYPQIITQEQFDAVTARREKKKPAIQKTEAQKVLKRKCKAEITPEIERAVLSRLNSLCRASDKIKPATSPTEKSEMVDKLEGELETLLEQLPVEETAAKQTIFQLAAARYEALRNEEYETQRLQRIFTNREPSQELDAELVKGTVSEVIVAPDGSVSIRLKNNQIIGRR